MDQPKAVELAGTEGAYAPFFSPDRQWVAFFAQTKLKKISVEGGSTVDLCSIAAGGGGSWGEDGNIIAILNRIGGGLSRIPSAGGAPVPVTGLAQGELTHRWPQILPGGKAVLFTSSASLTEFDGANIEVMSLADHRRKALERGGPYGRYVPGPKGTGHLVYVNKGTMFAVPFDAGKLEVRGTPSPVLEDVVCSTIRGEAQFDFSRNGTLVYRTGGAEGGDLLTVQWLDAAGKTQPLLAEPGVYRFLRLSPDGQRLAFGDGGHLGVRLAAGHDDAFDIFRIEQQPGLDPGRTVYRVHCSGRRHVGDSFRHPG
jgi:serine/threonine-protein kinase